MTLLQKPLQVLRACGAALVLGAGGAVVAGGVLVAGGEGDWPSYGGHANGDHFSGLTQITPANVAQLAPAWRLDMEAGGLQASPLMIDGTLFALTPGQGVIALDPATGAKKWTFTPEAGGQQPVRGLAYWAQDGAKALFTSHGTFLTALDPASRWPVSARTDTSTCAMG